MTNPSLQEIDEQFDIEFPLIEIVGENEADGTFVLEKDREKVKAFYRKVIAERDEALRKEIHSKSILIRGIKEIDGKFYVRIDREDFNGNSVVLFDSSVLSLLSKE